MSYLAIARKYRPATFEEIVGQDLVTRTLQNALELGRVHHAFLFTGARGVGKTTAARALARSLNCEKGPTVHPCGTCTSCTEIAAGISPDLIEIDGASNNSVDDVRELRETVRYAPTRGRWKIYLVDEVHMLSKGAFNALLKTLEEPPPHVAFIFATTEPNRIPDTILSRVQRFDFKRIPEVSIAARLKEIAQKEGVRISDAALRDVARAGDGSMRDAQSLLDQVISYAGKEIEDRQVVETLGLVDRNLLYETLAGLVEGKPERCFEAIDQVYRYGYELSEYTGELLEVLRNATFLRLSPTVRRYVDVSDDEAGRLLSLVEGVDAEALTRTFTALVDVHDQVSRSSRPRIVLEMAIARLCTIRPVQPVGGLLERLEGLERRLRQTGSTPTTSGLRSDPAPRRVPEPTLARDRAPEPPPARDRAPEPPPARDRAPEPPPARDRAPAPPAPADEAQAWRAFREEASGIQGTEILRAGTPHVIEDVLWITLPDARVAAEARLAAKRPEIRALFARHFPSCHQLKIVQRAGPDAASDEADAALKRSVMADPHVRRITEGLDAQLEGVIPQDEGDT